MLSVILCLCMLLACIPAACADATDADEMKIFNDGEIESIVNDYLSSRNISAEKVSIGFCYTATGDEWFLNGDEWIYPASLYKVPLMMLLSEKVRAGELTQESSINGMSVAQIEEYIIVYSNNDWSHTIRAYLGGDEAWRTEARKYARLSDDEYSPDYLTYCYFTARYITEVVETLYASPDSFPNIIECMGQAKPGEYLRTNIEGQYSVAQKYGSYIEPNGTWNNHAVGIIYTPNPIIVSIMTRNVDNYNAVIGDIAELLTRYALTLDEKLEIFEQQKLAAQVAAEREAQEKAAAEQRASEEAERAAAERAAEEKAAAEAAEKEAERAQRAEKLKSAVKLGLKVIVVVALAAAALLFLAKRRKKSSPNERRYPEKYDESGYEELWDDYDPENGKKTPRTGEPRREKLPRRDTADADKAPYRRENTPAESAAYRENDSYTQERAYRENVSHTQERAYRYRELNEDSDVLTPDTPDYKPRRRAPDAAQADAASRRDYAYGRQREKYDLTDEADDNYGDEFEKRFSQGRAVRRESYDEPRRTGRADGDVSRRSTGSTASSRGRKRGRHEL